jgi:phospholipase/carboxylesterase
LFDPLPSVQSIIVEPEGTKPVATIVFLHGLGASAHDFEPVAHQLLPILPLRWVLPNAPSLPVTLMGGTEMAAWYDITDLTRADGVDWDSVKFTREYVRNLLRIEHENLPDVPLILGGFSQGGSIALHCGLDSPVPLKGVVALSSYLLAHEGDSGLPSGFDASTAPQVFMGHGEWDDVVPPELADIARQTLQNAGVNLEWHTYPMPHSVCPQELQDLVFWLMSLMGIVPEAK